MAIKKSLWTRLFPDARGMSDLKCESNIWASILYLKNLNTSEFYKNHVYSCSIENSRHVRNGIFP